jgi:hypothetical protein
MMTDTISAVFEDFNEPCDEPVPPPNEDESQAAAEIGEIRQMAWTEGYLMGCRINSTPSVGQPLAAKLLTSVHDLSRETALAVDAASLAVADLLIQAVIAVTSDDWSAQLMQRVRSVADRIRPALTIAPEYLLRDAHGTEQCFGEMADLARALEAGTGEDVTIRWQRGEATIDRTAWLDELREAIVPLSGGNVIEQNARSQT